MIGALPRRLLLALLIGVLLLAPPAVRADYTMIDKLALLDLLEQGDYEALDERFWRFRELVDSGEMSDDVQRYAFTTFNHSAPATTAKLDDWVEAQPSSSFALLARAFHLTHLAILHRGSGYANRRAEALQKAMRENFDRATADAQQALEVNGKAAVAYGLLIKIGKYSGNRALCDWALERGLAAVPGSQVIRRSYLLAIEPRWGGSLDEIRSRLAEWNGMSASGYLRGYHDFAMARALSWRGQRRKARQYFDRAVQLQEDASYLYARGMNLSRGALDDFGFADVNRALAQAPHWPSALSTRAFRLSNDGQQDRADADWRLALRLDPLNPEILRDRSDALERQERYAEALADMDTALVYGAFDADIRLRRGRLKIKANDDREGAREDLLRATELAPNTGKYWYHYAEALTEGPLSQKRECRAVTAFRTYLEVCERMGGCDSDNLAVARFFTEQRPKRYGWCL